MMAKGSWAATGTSSELVAADEYRGAVIIQILSGNPVALAFGEAAVFGEGIQLTAVGDSVVVNGAQARGVIYGTCEAEASAAGGYQEA